jgi:recombination protein RecT
VDVLLEEVRQRESDLAAYLPDGVKPERFMALAKRAITEQPALAECSASSVLRALRAAALSGLELDGNFSSLIVRRPKQGKPIAVWSASYRGMTAQAMASGVVSSVDSQVVREADTFELVLGTEPKLVHRLSLTGARGGVVACYCVVTLANGATLHEVMTHEDIARVRAASPAGDRGPWGPWDDEMAKKAVVRRALKRLPATSTRAPVAQHARALVNAVRRTEPVVELTPEHENAMECTALEQLAGATTVVDLDNAWMVAQHEFKQRGAEVPLAVEARWRELRESFTDSTA